MVKIHRNSKLGRHVYNKKKKKKVTTIERLSKRYKIQQKNENSYQNEKDILKRKKYERES